MTKDKKKIPKGTFVKVDNAKEIEILNKIGVKNAQKGVYKVKKTPKKEISKNLKKAREVLRRVKKIQTS